MASCGHRNSRRPQDKRGLRDPAFGSAEWTRPASLVLIHPGPVLTIRFTDRCITFLLSLFIGMLMPTPCVVPGMLSETNA